MKLAQMREAYEKPRADGTSGMNTRHWQRTAFSLEICSEWHKPCVQLQEVYQGTDNVFWNVAAWKVFRNFRKYGPFDDDEGTVLALIRFNAVIIDCIQSFEKPLSESESYIDSETEQFKSRTDLRKTKIWASIGGPIAPECSSRLQSFASGSFKLFFSAVLKCFSNI